MGVFDQLADRRAFAGALALLLAGVQTTATFAAFFAGPETRAVFQARWFWEIALNFQIFLFFLMWVCHTDRISNATGWRKVRAVSRMVTGLFGVAPPFLTLIVCARNNWFYEKPAFAVVQTYALILLVAWALVAYVLPFLLRLLSHQQHFIYLAPGGRGMRAHLVNLAPFLLFLGAGTLSHLMNWGYFYWVLLPVAAYVHGALPYLYKAYRADPADDMADARADEAVAD